MESMTLMMVKWSDRSDRVVATKPRLRCLSQDGRGRLWHPDVWVWVGVTGIPSWKSVPSSVENLSIAAVKDVSILKACLSIRSTMRSFDKGPTGRAKSV
ncbi:unnamed protein product [Prunus brigantina]